MTSTTIRFGIFVTMALAFGGPVAATDDALLRAPSASSTEDDAATADQAATAVHAPGWFGAWIWVDPVTGALVGTRPEGVATPRPLVTAAATASGEDLPAFQLRGGGRGVHLDGRFLTSTRVVVDPSGALRVTCGEDHDHTSDVDPGGKPPLEPATATPEAPRS